MSHLVSYKYFRITQYIPRFGGVLQEMGKIVEGFPVVDDVCETCEIVKR